jgi:hypothetical protein
MGGSHTRAQRTGLASYGEEYDPYYAYGDIENYGASYGPIQEDNPYRYLIADQPFTTTKIRRGSSRRSGLNRYGNSYSPTYSAMLHTLGGKAKVRIIYMPSNLVSGLQNLLQSNGFNGMNPIAQGIPGYNIPGMIPQMGSNYYPMSSQVPSMVPHAFMPVPCPPPMIQPVIQPMPMRK